MDVEEIHIFEECRVELDIAMAFELFQFAEDVDSSVVSHHTLDFLWNAYWLFSIDVWSYSQFYDVSLEIAHLDVGGAPISLWLIDAKYL